MMIFTAPDVASVAESLSRWELGEYISAGFVVVACAGELVADFGRNCLTRAHRNRVERLSTILLVVALLASLICLERANVLSDILIGSIRDKAVEADRKANTALTDSGTALMKAGDATTKAGEAETKVTGVVKQTDALTSRMERASRQLGRLEKDTTAQGPRAKLLVKAAQELARKLAPFAGQRVGLFVCGQQGLADQETIDTW